MAKHSKKVSAQRAKFKKAFKACRAAGKKPFTKSFGACMKAKLKKGKK